MTLVLKTLAFGYRDREIGHGVDLALRGGEVLALLGPNGAGKTTLFKTMLGLLPVKAGEILLDGRPLSGWSRRERALRIAYVPQAHAAPFPFTVRDLVLMGRAAHLSAFALPGGRDHAIADAALENLGIAKLADVPATEISGGERQLALIARALAQEASIVVMDEPTASLDYGNQMRLLARIRGLAAEGLAIVLSTHNPDHALQSADRVALLKDGALAALGVTRETLTADALKTLYGIDVVIGSVPGSDAFVCAPRLDRS